MIDDYDQKYMKSVGDLPLKETLEFDNKIIAARVVFQKDNKYYLQAFLDKCFFKIINVKL